MNTLTITLIIAIILISWIIYLYKTSENLFFYQDPEKLKEHRKNLIKVLKLQTRTDEDIKRYTNAFDYFVKNPHKYDGDTVVRDLPTLRSVDLDKNGRQYRLSAESMEHDYIWCLYPTNLWVKLKSNWDYMIELLRNGKGLHLDRFIGLTIITPFHTLYKMIIKYNKI